MKLAEFNLNTISYSLATIACLAVMCVTALSQSAAKKSAPFQMLIVGDSHISGQGLREKDKFYSLVRDWLQDEMFESREVNLKVKAHAGSRIDMHPEELAAMRKAGDDINKFHYAEANISSPTITASYFEEIKIEPIRFHVAGTEPWTNR